MTAIRYGAVVAALLLGACGAGPEAPVPSNTQLGYSLPAVNPVTYTSADTAEINIMVQPGMAMEQTMGQHSTVRLAFAPIMGTAGTLSVTATYVDFGAFMESSMMPRQDIDGDALSGEFVLSLTPDGEVELVSGPDLPEEIQQMSMGSNLFADFFIRLPNEIVAPGATWTDTITADDETDGARMTNRTIVASTFRGDTTVAGRTLWILEATRSTDLVVEGDMQGMPMRNELSGTVRERTLWDPARRIMHSSRSSGTMTGTVSIPGAGMENIPIEVSNRRHIRLVEGAS